FNEIIQLPECRALRQRITLFYDLEPLTENETPEYVAHRLMIAGATGQLFTSEAIHRIYRFTKGYPRLINILCDRALLTGYGREQRKIDTAILKECSGELKFIHLFKKTDSFKKIDQHRLMLIGLAGLLTLVFIAVGISMNFRSSSIGHDVSDKADTVLGDQHENLSVHQNLETPSQPSENLKHPVSEKNVEGAMEKESKAPDQETATVVVGTVEEKQSLSIPAQPGELLEKAPTKQLQPATFDLTNQPIHQATKILAQPSENLKHLVSEKNVEGAMEKESKAPDQETATVVVGTVEEKQSLSIPAQPGELLEKAPTKQLQPATFDFTNQPIHQATKILAQPSENLKHLVSEKNVEGAMEKESKAPDQETATVVVGTVEEKQSLSIPARYGELLEKASTKQLQPTTFDLATIAVEQGNFLLGIDLLESQGKNNVSNNSATSELYAKALVGRAEQVGISPGTEAKSLLRRAVDVNPNNSDAHFNLGKLFTQSKDYALAVVSYQNATRLDPGLTDAFFNLGYIYATTGNYIDAEETFIRVVQLAPKYQDKALVNLALIQDKLGKREDCLANLHKAVIRNSANVKAQNYLKKLLVRTEAIQ
ncbi:MAG: tetratricopeptide (TPR) repeat protein, partial [Desulforhopalus sp.]